MLEIKQSVEQLLETAIQALYAKYSAIDQQDQTGQLERNTDHSHGDFSSSIAMRLAKSLKNNPRQIAQELQKLLPSSKYLEKTEVAGAGFINFYLRHSARQDIVKTVLDQAKNYGNAIANNKRVHLEFVSANPTGPLHVGHGRGVAYGSCLANILDASGYQVTCEYYINDAGRQVNILCVSVWIAYLQSAGLDIRLPQRAYQGLYIKEYAQQLYAQDKQQWLRDLPITLTENAIEPTESEAQEAQVDLWIKQMHHLLGEESFNNLRSQCVEHILQQIREELKAFRVDFTSWFSESSLIPEKTEAVLTSLKQSGYTEERDGNLWFLSTQFNDDKDRVLRRRDGSLTYFATDIAYHLHKYQQGYDRIINIWGADHHGYIGRIRAALQALKQQEQKLEIRLVQLVNLRRGNKAVTMSTRQGAFVNLSQLREEIGVDAARFFYLMRRCDQATDFDLDVAKTMNEHNPVYYIQYAHARICSAEKHLQDQYPDQDYALAIQDIKHLQEPEENALLCEIPRYPEIIVRAAAECAPHILCNYLQDLAAHFHTYYNAHRIAVENQAVRNARLCLALSVRQVLANGLSLLGLDALETM